MALTTRRLTFDDLEMIPEEHEGDRHELIDGELIVSPPPISAHQLISGNIDYALAHHVRSNHLGRVFHAPTGVRFTPYTMLIPDIVFIGRDRVHIIGPKTIDGAPELVVEILSPGTRRRDLNEKRDLYARFGVQEYWIVDPEKRTVTVLALKGDKYEAVPVGDEGAIRSRVLPGLTLDLDAVFEGVAKETSTPTTGSP